MLIQVLGPGCARCREAENVVVAAVREAGCDAENSFQGWMFDGGEVVANAEANRLQIIFADKPDEVLRGLLKKRGFKWSPRFHAWQRQLTSNAVHAAKEILTANL